MKRVIDVSDTLYKTCILLVSKGDPRPSESCIANSEPYEPQGDCISREALKNELTRLGWTEANGFKDRYVLDDIIDNIQVVEPDRPQGEWVYRQEWFEDEKEPRMAWGCNHCGFSIKSVHEMRNFCPNCGAKMRGGTA